MNVSSIFDRHARAKFMWILLVVDKMELSLRIQMRFQVIYLVKSCYVSVIQFTYIKGLFENSMQITLFGLNFSINIYNDESVQLYTVLWAINFKWSALIFNLLARCFSKYRYVSVRITNVSAYELNEKILFAHKILQRPVSPLHCFVYIVEM